MADVTRLLGAAAAGDRQAAAELLSVVYDELRRLAHARMADERHNHTLDATALVHEAYIRLFDRVHPQQWNGRGHFFAAAARAMREILVDHARRKIALVHGGGWKRVDLDQVTLPLSDDHPAELLALDEALTKLEQHDQQAAELVKLRFFAGLKHHEAASILGISRGDADRQWALARAWLYRCLSAD